MSEHLFLPLREVWWEIALLRLTFNFAPLSSLDCLGDIVGSRSGVACLGNNPGGGRLWICLVDLGCKSLWFSPLEIGVVILCRRILHGDPFLMLGEVDSLIAEEIIAWRFDEFLQSFLVVELTRGWRFLFVFHDIVGESLASFLQELSCSTLDVISPVGVALIFRSWDVTDIVGL